MEAAVVAFADCPHDQPIPLLDRWCLTGDQMLAARVVLHPGCSVAPHRHASEQIAIVVSGCVKWFLGDEGKEVVVTGGNFVFLPANLLHGVVAIEETLIFDILSPVGPMGVDSQTD